MPRSLTRLCFVCVLLVSTFVIAPEPAHALVCNDDPCSNGIGGIVCTSCRDWIYVGNYLCQRTVIYCVSCTTGEILSWDEDIDFCFGGPV